MTQIEMDYYKVMMCEIKEISETLERIANSLEKGQKDD